MSQLNPEQVALLQPSLQHIADTIARRGGFDQQDLSVLQLGLGIDEPWAGQELDRWVGILLAAREPGRAGLSQQALVMRGVAPDAAARAVATVAQTPAAPAAVSAAPPPAPAAGNPWRWIIPLVALLLLGAMSFAFWQQRAASQTVLAPATTAPTSLPPTIPPTAAPPTTAPASPTARNDAAPPLVALTATAIPTQAASPTTAATRPPAAPTATRPTPTPIPPTRTPRPRATLTTGAQACAPPPGGSFLGLYADLNLFEAMGCPTTPERGIVTAYEPFERGFMVYRQDKALIYAIYNDGTWQQFPDTWREGEPEYSCSDNGTPSRTPPTPRRGIGKVWCAQPGVRDKLGNALQDENGNTRSVQDFQQGVMVYIIERDVPAYALVGSSGRWFGG